jgi:hypothetical protein
MGFGGIASWDGAKPKKGQAGAHIHSNAFVPVQRVVSHGILAMV